MQVIICIRQKSKNKKNIRVIALIIVFLVVTVTSPSVSVAEQPKGSAQKRSQQTMRPHLLVTARKIKGLRSLAEVRTAIKSGHTKKLWEAMIARADADMSTPPLEGGNRSYPVVNAAGVRLLRHAMAAMILGRPAGNRYRDAAVAQLECLFDPARWPNWNDPSHTRAGIDAKQFFLRHGQLSRDIGLAYDWLYTTLTPAQRKAVIDGLNTYAIPQFRYSADGHGYRGTLDRANNIMVCIIGGAAILGMALAEDHPESQFLMDMAADRDHNPYSESFGRMDSYVYGDIAFGPEGSWNESVGYSGSTNTLITYVDALHYHKSAQADAAGPHPLGAEPYPKYCRWVMYMTMPPGRQACLGDAQLDTKMCMTYFPAVAAASGDQILQWAYLNNLYPPNEGGYNRHYPLELLWFDPTVGVRSPEGILPHGKIFPSAKIQKGAAGWVPLSSRTNWNQASTPSAVFGRGGPAFFQHGNYDAGQICIEGYGQRLIIDQGYKDPLEYHNLLMFDQQNMTYDGIAVFAPLVHSEFDDTKGAYWTFDTQHCYGGGKVAEHVLRTVVHLHPATVVVLDQAKLYEPRDISLRWHTVTAAKPDNQGRFTVKGGNDVNLASRVVRLDEGSMKVFGRQKEDVEATEATMTDDKCRILSVFNVFAPGVKPNNWYDDGKFISIDTPEGRVDVQAEQDKLTVSNRGTGLSWIVPLNAAVPLKDN